MYKIFFSVIFLSFAGYSFAQNVSSVDVTFNKLDRDDAFIISPTARFDFNNHSWSIGPALLFSFGDQIEERDAFKLTGLTIGYENYLHGRDTKWNMFHSFDFIFQRIKDVQNSQVFDTNSGSFIPNTIEQVDNSIYIGGGAGMLLNLGSKFSITQTIGIGANVIFRDTQSDIDAFKDTFFKQQWSLKTGVRYRIND
ncbi:hypothetical protein [Ekhidna sp.]